MRNFKCKKCGSGKLAYQKYARHVSPVNVQNGSLIYEEGRTNEDDHLPAEFGYVCRECSLPVRHAGRWLQSEEELITYLTADPQILAEDERVYEAYATAMAEEQDTEEE